MTGDDCLIIDAQSPADTVSYLGGVRYSFGKPSENHRDQSFPLKGRLDRVNRVDKRWISGGWVSKIYRYHIVTTQMMQVVRQTQTDNRQIIDKSTFLLQNTNLFGYLRFFLYLCGLIDVIWERM